MSENYAKVKDDPSIKRDMRTGAIVMSNDELEAYRKKRAKILAERDRDREFKILKNEVSDIKNLLAELINKLS